MNCKKTMDIIKINSAEKLEITDEIIVEQMLNIYVNREHYASLMCTPIEKTELAAGFLFAEGIISSVESIKSIEELTEDIVCIMLEYELEENSKYIKAFTSGCARGSVNLRAFEQKNLKPIQGMCKYSANDILARMKEFSHKSELFKDTGGVHSCAICSNEELLLFSEDIGRHNAMDKVIGKALMDKIRLDDKLLLTTGRISSDMALKAARAGLPIIVSHSAPTDMAVDIARKADIAIAGFARGNRMNIYCCSDRIII